MIGAGETPVGAIKKPAEKFDDYWTKACGTEAGVKDRCLNAAKRYFDTGTELFSTDPESEGQVTSEQFTCKGFTPAFSAAVRDNEGFRKDFIALKKVACNGRAPADVFKAEAPVAVAPAPAPAPVVAPAPAPAVAPVAPVAPAAPPALGAAITPPRSVLDDVAEAGEDEDEETPTAAQLEARATGLEKKAAEKKEKAEELHAEQIELHVAIATDATNRPAAAAKWNEFKIAEREAKAAEKAAKKARVEAEKARAEEGTPAPRTDEAASHDHAAGEENKLHFSIAVSPNIDGLHTDGSGLSEDSALTDVSWFGYDLQLKFGAFGIHYRQTRTSNDAGDNASVADILQLGAIYEPDLGLHLKDIKFVPYIRGAVTFLAGGNDRIILIDNQKAGNEDFAHLTYALGFRLKYSNFFAGIECQNPAVLANRVGGMKVDEYQGGTGTLRAKLPTWVVPVGVEF